ncbi:MAG: endonuclease/exonuclease/phosphatase family protein [Spirochaetales bacterium]
MALLSAVPTPLGAFEVLTWNVGLLRVAGFDVVPRVEKRAAEIPAALARWATESSLDVIVLQEVWDDAHARAIEAALGPLGYEFYRPADRSWTGIGSGLLLAWRSQPGNAPLQLVSSEFAAWKVREGVEAFSQKGVARVQLHDPESGATFGVTDFHLAAQGSAAGEAEQLRQLAQMVESVPSAQVEILAGDANAGPGCSEDRYQQLLSLPGFEEALGPGIVTWDPANPLVHEGVFPNEPAAWIDHILTRGLPAGTVRVEVPVTGASDHYPLLARW